ncbi:MAG: L-lactate permease [Terracidiphilus sp.]
MEASSQPSLPRSQSSSFSLFSHRANSSLGLALAATGAVFPFLSPLLGWLGVLLSGSDASSNALFGPSNGPRRK